MSKITSQEIDQDFLKTIRIPYIVCTGADPNKLIGSDPELIGNYYKSYTIKVEPNMDSTGPCTVNINTKLEVAILDTLKNPVTNMKKGVPYTLVFNGSNFILQGKGGGGNAIAEHLLIGEKATVDSGQIVGTMPDNGNITITAGKDPIIIPKGYHNGLGTVNSDPTYVDQLQSSSVFLKNPWMYIAKNVPVAGNIACKGFLYNKKIYVMTQDHGDPNLYILDITTNIWSVVIIEAWRTYKPNTAYEYHYKNCIYNGVLYFPQERSTFDLNTLIFTTNNMQDPFQHSYIRDGMSCCAYDGKIYMLGGSNREGDVGRETDAGAYFYIYDIATKNITIGPNMPSIGSLVGCCAYNGKIYRLGGTVNGGGGHYWPHMYTAFEIYDIAKGTWSVGAPMPEGRDSIGCAGLDGKIYAFGGESGFKGSSYGFRENTWIYNITSNTWSIGVDMSTKQRNVDCLVSDHKIFVLGDTKAINVYVP